MRKIFLYVLLFSVMCGLVFSQQMPEMKLYKKEKPLVAFESSNDILKKNAHYDETFQLKKRKTVNSYFGAGYSFIIFTDGELSSIYPVLDTRSGAFLTNISLFFGFALSQVVSLEFEPGILFASSSKSLETYPVTPPAGTPFDTIAYSGNIGLFSLPLSANVRIFPMYKMTSFARLFFIGGGIGYQWIKEDYDIFYSRTRQPIGYYGGVSASDDQWAPVFRIMTGFTGTGGQFGFGGEVRYNIVPLKEEAGSPFATRRAKNFNSVDISLRFYFSL